MDVLGSARAFCDLVADARQWKFPGYWSGSAFRRHPCGVIEGAMKLTNEWSTFNYCCIQITDGDGWSNDYSRDSFGHGDPHPRPLDGHHAVVVWNSGRWSSDEFRQALESKVRDLVERIQAHVASAKDKAAKERETAEAAARDRRRQVELAALARVQGGARP